MASGQLKSTRSKVMAFVVYMGLAAAVGGVLGYMDGGREAAGQLPLVETSIGLWIGLALGIAGAVLGMGYGFYWMRSIDEAAQEAHKWSWYWGGSAGLALGMVGLIVAMVPASAQLSVPAFSGRTDPVAYMAAGAVCLILLMTIGYGLAWLWWWWSRR
jgi:hypothetical protein